MNLTFSISYFYFHIYLKIYLKNLPNLLIYLQRTRNLPHRVAWTIVLGSPLTRSLLFFGRWWGDAIIDCHESNVCFIFLPRMRRMWYCVAVIKAFTFIFGFQWSHLLLAFLQSEALIPHIPPLFEAPTFFLSSLFSLKILLKIPHAQFQFIL